MDHLSQHAVIYNNLFAEAVVGPITFLAYYVIGCRDKTCAEYFMTRGGTILAIRAISRHSGENVERIHTSAKPLV